MTRYLALLILLPLTLVGQMILFETLFALLAQPVGLARRVRRAAGNHGVAAAGQALADGSTDTAHAAGDVSDSKRHCRRLLW